MLPIPVSYWKLLLPVILQN